MSRQIRLYNQLRRDDGFMATLLDMPRRKKHPHLTLRVTLDEDKKGQNMRCIFTTELKVDIRESDDALRKAFIDLVLSKAREAFGVAGMLAKNTPVINVHVTSRDGREDIPVFAAPVRDTYEDEVD